MCGFQKVLQKPMSEVGDAKTIKENEARTTLLYLIWLLYIVVVYEDKKTVAERSAYKLGSCLFDFMGKEIK